MDECVLWTKGRNAKGYGIRRVAGRTALAHRVAWALAHGPIPPGLCVLHRCDNPPCVNVEHLFLGTTADNTADMVRKGRQRGAQGARHGRRTMPERTARGARHGSRTHPERIARGERNGSVCHPESRPRGEENGRAKLSAADVIAIRRSLDARAGYGRLAAQYGVSKATIAQIATRRIWRHVA